MELGGHTMIKNKMNTKLKKGIFSAVAVVVLIAAVIAVNIFVTSKNYTVDVTDEENLKGFR